jgi:hypothetical protein
MHWLVESALGGGVDAHMFESGLRPGIASDIVLHSRAEKEHNRHQNSVFDKARQQKSQRGRLLPDHLFVRALTDVFSAPSDGVVANIAEYAANGLHGDCRRLGLQGARNVGGRLQII